MQTKNRQRAPRYFHKNDVTRLTTSEYLVSPVFYITQQIHEDPIVFYLHAGKQGTTAENPQGQPLYQLMPRTCYMCLHLPTNANLISDARNQGLGSLLATSSPTSNYLTSTGSWTGPTHCRCALDQLQRSSNIRLRE